MSIMICIKFEVEKQSNPLWNSLVLRIDADINVKSFTGKTLSLQVKGSDPLGNLKRMIRDKESIPISEQALIYKEMVLEGIIILAEFGIKKGSTLTLMRKSRGGSMMQIFVKTHRGRLIRLQVKLSDTIRNVKSQIRDYWDP